MLVDEEVKNCMVKRDVANIYVYIIENYCKYVTKLKKKKKKLYYEANIKDIKNDGKNV